MEKQSSKERNLFWIGSTEGPGSRIETLVSQLRSARHYLLNAARDLTAQQLDAVAPGCPNTIGALLAHVAAAETMFQNITCHGRQFSEDEGELRQAFRFERNWLSGEGFGSYREHLWRNHEETAALLGPREDGWLDTPATFMGGPCNFHYYWTHLLMDEARHTGQIILIRKHLMPGHDPAFQPYTID